MRPFETVPAPAPMSAGVRKIGCHQQYFAVRRALDRIRHRAHELCHIAEPHHGAAFYRLLGRVMPDWEERKARLEVAMA